jgi:DNA-directed RNA polymerase specialized sigma54-like protein
VCSSDLDGINYPMGFFFSHTTGKKTENIEEIKKFFSVIIEEENKMVNKLRAEQKPIKENSLLDDKKIAEMYNKFFQPRDRKTIERYRRKFGIKPVYERLKDYLSAYK